MHPNWQNLAHIEATIRFLSTEDGGRRTPAKTGYRPQFYCQGRDWDATRTYPDVEWVYPGETVRAFLTFLSPDAHRGRIFPGMAFEIREGPRVVASGVVTRVLDL